MYVHYVGDGYGQTDHLCEARAQPVVDQYSRVLWVVPELNDIVIAVGAAHEMALRATAHPADVLNGLNWHGSVPIDSCGALTAVVGDSEGAGRGLALMDQTRLAVSFIRGPLWSYSSSHLGRFGSMALSTAMTWCSTEERWANGRRKPLRSSAKPSDTRRSLWKRRSRGNAAGWWSAPAKERCQSW